MDISLYNDFASKSISFTENQVIETESQLDSVLTKLISMQDSFIFRGIKDASFKLFTSSQFQWMKSGAIDKLPDISYYHQFISDMIRVVSYNPVVREYAEKENMSYNEMFILAMMQHYGMPSPMLDFSHSLLNSLFFSVDGFSASESRKEIENYISLYYVPSFVDWIQCSVQNVMLTGADRINNMLAGDEMFHRGKVDTTDVEREFRVLPYYKISDFDFIPVDDNPKNTVQISIPIMNFNCEYRIVNDRIISQQGMFIINNTSTKPLVELMNDITKEKFFRCLNIHKRLVPYIYEKYLSPNGIDKNTVYCLDNELNNNIDQEFVALRDKVYSYLKDL